MNDHVLKPLLIGLFILVLLVTAGVFTYSSAPQASEITPRSTSTASPAAASSTAGTEAYTAPYSGMSECNDGQDNDGDGLADWSDSADVTTIDPDCDSARDRSERYSGLQ